MIRTGAALTATLLASAISGAAMAGTIEVRPGQSIEAALKAARPGDTVAVRAGTYHESVYAHASGVKLVSVDGKGAAHIVSKSGTALFLQGGSGTEIRGFAITAGPRGNGIQVGGSASGGVIRNLASGYVVADNIIHDAGLDGIKVHQAKGFSFTGNVIENAGTGNKGNSDGGIDFVSVTDSKLEGNTIIKTGGNSCVMLKGGTARNTITGNSFGGCKDAIHLGGFTSDSVAKRGIKEAYDNSITGNNLCGREMAFRLFPGEAARRDNITKDNGCSGAPVGPTMAGGPINVGYAPLNAEKITNDIATMRGNGLNDSAIKYVLGLDGIKVPDEVLSGGKTVQDAIADGTMKQDAAQTSWSPPALQPTPAPDLTPQGSSAGGWKPNTQMPAINAMRQSITSKTKPPNC